MLSMKKEGALLKNVKKISRDAAGRIPGILQIFIKFYITAAGQRNRNHVGTAVAFDGIPFGMEEVPVSYTHLDVYKRQVLILPSGIVRTCDFASQSKSSLHLSMHLSSAHELVFSP